MRGTLKEERFQEYMDTYTFRPQGRHGCWEWQGSLNHAGYGQWTYGGLAHRKMYEFVRGSIPANLQLDHLCRNRRCVNPGHLEPVTAKENQNRSPISLTTINKSKTHCPNGHEYNEENTYYRPNNKGRKCRKCNAERWH